MISKKHIDGNIKSLRIDGCSFGVLVINGKEFTSDLIIYPDGNIADSWWRKNSHRLSSNDIDGLIQCGPEIIIGAQASTGL